MQRLISEFSIRMSRRKKFDKGLKYIRKWNPDFEKDILENRIVEHKFARERALETYKKGLN